MSAQQALLELLVMAEEMSRRGDDVPDVKGCQVYGAEIKRLVALSQALVPDDVINALQGFVLGWHAYAEGYTKPENIGVGFGLTQAAEALEAYVKGLRER